MMSKGDYEVGYGKPPKRTRFKPGEVNSPDGRRGRHGPKAKRSPKDELGHLFGMVLEEKQTVTMNGQPKKMSRAEIFIRKLIDDANAGKAAARQNLLSLMEKFPELIKPDVRPSGIIEFRMQNLRGVSLDQFLEEHPNTLDEDLPVLRKYFTKYGEPGVPFHPAGEAHGNNIVLPHPVPPRKKY